MRMMSEAIEGAASFQDMMRKIQNREAVTQQEVQEHLRESLAEGAGSVSYGHLSRKERRERERRERADARRAQRAGVR